MGEEVDMAALVQKAASAFELGLQRASVESRMKALPGMKSNLHQLANEAKVGSIDEICGDKINHLNTLVGPAPEKRPAVHTRKGTAGPGWFEMPEGDMTEEVKQDLKMIQMRNYLD